MNALASALLVIDLTSISPDMCIYNPNTVTMAMYEFPYPKRQITHSLVRSLKYTHQRISKAVTVFAHYIFFASNSIVEILVNVQNWTVGIMLDQNVYINKFRIPDWKKTHQCLKDTSFTDVSSK